MADETIGSQLDAIMESVRNQLPSVDDDDDDEIGGSELENLNISFDELGVIQHPLRNIRRTEGEMWDPRIGTRGLDAGLDPLDDLDEETREFFRDLDMQFGPPQAQGEPPPWEPTDLDVDDLIPQLDLRGRFSQVMQETAPWRVNAGVERETRPKPETNEHPKPEETKDVGTEKYPEAEDERPPNGGEFRGHSAHTLRMIEIVRAFHETYDINQNDETTNPGGVLSNNFVARVFSNVMPQLPDPEDAPPIGDGFQDDTIVRAVRRVRDQAVAERKDTEEKDEIERRRQKEKEERKLREQQVNADSENKRNEARRHYREVLERTPEKYKQFMPPPVPEKTLSDHLNERVPPEVLEEALDALEARGDTSCPWMDAITPKLISGEELTLEDFPPSDDEADGGRGDNINVGRMSYTQMREQHDREMVMLFLRNHEKMTGEKLTEEALGYAPFDQESQNPRRNPFRPQPPPLPPASQVLGVDCPACRHQNSTSKSSPQAEASSKDAHHLCRGIKSQESAKSIGSKSTSKKSSGAKTAGSSVTKSSHGSMTTKSSGTSPVHAAAKSTGTSTVTASRQSPKDDATMTKTERKSTGVGTRDTRQGVVTTDLHQGVATTDLHQYAEVRRTLQNSPDPKSQKTILNNLTKSVNASMTNMKPVEIGGSEDTSSLCDQSAASPFWKLEEERQNFESVRRILGLGPREEEESSSSSEEEEEDWGDFRQGARSSEGWGRFRSGD